MDDTILLFYCGHDSDPKLGCHVFRLGESFPLSRSVDVP